MLRSILSVLLMLSFSGATYASSTFRCNSALVSLGASMQEVRNKCGEPVAKENIGFKQRINQYGHTHQLHVAEWLYGPKGGMYYFLRFEGGDLAKISSTR